MDLSDSSQHADSRRRLDSAVAMKTIVIGNHKGGVGKTTIASHVAWHLAGQGRRVLVVDTDPQGNLTNTISGAVVDTNIISLFTDDVAAPANIGAEPGTYRIVANKMMATLPANDPKMLQRFTSNLRQYAGAVDYVVIDTPPTSAPWLYAIYLAADFVLIPFHLEPFSLAGIESQLRALLMLQQKFSAAFKFGLVISTYDGMKVDQRVEIESIVQRFLKILIPGRISKRQSYVRIGTEKKPVWDMPGAGAKEAGREIKAVIEEILKRMETAE